MVGCFYSPEGLPREGTTKLHRWVHRPPCGTTGGCPGSCGRARSWSGQPVERTGHRWVNQPYHQVGERGWGCTRWLPTWVWLCKTPRAGREGARTSVLFRSIFPTTWAISKAGIPGMLVANWKGRPLTTQASKLRQGTPWRFHRGDFSLHPWFGPLCQTQRTPQVGSNAFRLDWIPYLVYGICFLGQGIPRM